MSKLPNTNDDITMIYAIAYEISKRSVHNDSSFEYLNRDEKMKVMTNLVISSYKAIKSELPLK